MKFKIYLVALLVGGSYFLVNGQNNFSSIEEKALEIWSTQKTKPAKKVEFRGEVNLLIATRIDFWDQNEEWAFQDSTLYSYDGQGQQTSSLSKQFENNEWINNRRGTTEYDDGNEVLFTGDRWNDESWSPNIRGFSFYENDLLVENYSQNWLDNAWENNTRYRYVYSPAGNLLEFAFDLGDGSSWDPVLETTVIAATSNGNILETESMFYNTATNQWELSGRTIYEYDTNGNRTYRESFDWDGQAFVPDRRIFYEFNELNQETLELHENWDDTANAFLPSLRYTNEYSIDGLALRFGYDLWDSEEESFVGNLEQLYEYDEQDRRVHTLERSFDTVNQNWVNEEQAIFYYATLLDLEEVKQPEALFRLFPNPVSSGTILNFHAYTIGTLHLRLIDRTGQIIWTDQHQLTTIGNQAIPLRFDLPVGAYWLQIQHPSEGISSGLPVLIVR